MSGLLDLIREAKRPERTVQLCLRGDLVGEFEALERHLREATTKPDDSFGGSGESRRIATRMEELREAMRAASVTFRLRSLGAMRSAAIIAEHAPRKDNDQDKRLGYNPETLYPALIRECAYAIERGDDTLDPAELGDDGWEQLLGALSSQQFDSLFGAAWILDHNDIEVPTSPLAFLISQRNGESSKQHGAGEPSPPTSQDGAGGRSRRTSTTKKAASSDQ